MSIASHHSRVNALRTALGIILSLLGISGLSSFGWWQGALAGWSADGVVVPYMWLVLRIMIVALAVPGVFLLAWPVLRGPLIRLDGWLLDLPGRRFVLYALGAAGLVRLTWVLAAPLHLFGDWKDYDDLAWRLIETGSLAEATHTTMYRPPGYPFFLSLFYRVFGHAPPIATLLNVLIGVGIVYLAYRLARDIWNETAARWTALVLIFFPSQILYLNLLSSEPLFTLLFLLSLWLFVRGLQSDGAALRWFAVSGLALGCATLVRSLTLTYPAVLLLILLHEPARRRLAWPRIAVLGLAMCLVLAPWFARNYALSGSVTFSTNTGMNFYIGNNPSSTFGFNTPDPNRFNFYSVEDEIEVERRAWKEGLEFIGRAPAAMVKRGVLKVAYFLTGDTDSWSWDLTRAADEGRWDERAWFGVFIQAYYYLFLLLFLLGLWYVWRTPALRNSGMWLYLLTIAYWLAVHFVFFGEGRYHYPIVALMAGCAGIAIEYLCRRRVGHSAAR